MKAILIAAVLALSLTACHDGKAAAQANLTEGQGFLAKNAKQPGVITLPDGLQYKVVTSGPADGVSPQPADEVKVDYEGKLLSGKVFDSSFARGVPADLPLQDLIPGWTEALQKMRPGDEWILYVPPNLGYGEEAKGPIPADSVLIFRIKLLGVLPHPGGMAG